MNPIIYQTPHFDALSQIMSETRFVPEFGIRAPMGVKNLAGEKQAEYAWQPAVVFHELPEHNPHAFQIAMKREWALAQGVSPVLYASENSVVAQAIDDLMNLRKILFTNEREKYLNALYQLQAATQTFAGKAYVTTDDGSLNAQGERTFYDEREWRFVPPAVADVPLLEVVATDAVPKDLAAFNRRLAADTNAHLRFTWDDVAYIQASQNAGAREQLAQLLENVQSGLSNLMRL